MNKSFLFTLALLLSMIAVGCGDDDNPTSPGEEGSLSNPEDVAVGTPLSGSLAAGETYYVAFKTSTAGDYTPELQADAVMTWVIYRADSAKAAVPEVIVGSCGVEQKGVDPSCTVTGLDAATEYILEMTNQDVSNATYVLLVTQCQGVGSVNDPVEWAGSFADCTDTSTGQVGKFYSYYKISETTGAGANQYYLFFSLSDDADFYVYSDPEFSVLLADATRTDTFDDYLDFVVPEDGVFYLRVDGGKTEDGATFTFGCDD
jgi:hypothetical protein